MMLIENQQDRKIIESSTDTYKEIKSYEDDTTREMVKQTERE